MNAQGKPMLKRLTALLLSLMFLLSTVEPAGFYAFAAELSEDESVVAMAEENTDEAEDKAEEKSEEDSAEESKEETQ